MTLVKRKPWGQFFSDPLFNDIPDIFNRDKTDIFPAINLIESEKNYEIELAVPGFKKGDFNIDIEGNNLIIQAENKSESEKKDKNFIRKEFSYNKFEKSFKLPDNVDEKNIEANYKDGVLKVTLNKLEVTKSEHKRSIDVK